MEPDPRPPDGKRTPVTPAPELRIEIEEDGEATPARTPAPSSPATSYTTDREMVYPGRSGTLAETHLLRSTGVQNESYTEEHWESEIKSFVTTAPPRFVQVIKAYRVLSTDILTLVVEVASDPPALFDWFCNDRSVMQDRRRFQTRHGLNITTLTVVNPERGVYKCTARNPAGTSTTYGYITVNSPPRYQDWSVTREEVREPDRVSLTINAAPRFINQVPNLTLKPGTEAVIDVEVDANPPARFTWFVNGYEFRDSSGKIQTFFPGDNRCVARFPMPVSGEYRVIAENVHGQAISSGIVEVVKDVSKMHRPPVAPGEHIARSALTAGGTPRMSRADRAELATSAIERSDSATRTKTEEVYEVNYHQRSSSLPRGVRHLEKHTEFGRFDRDGRSQEHLVVPEENEHPPKIVEPLHSSSFLDGQPMVLRCKISALPSAMIEWWKDDASVETWVLNKDVSTRVLPGGICELLNPECYPEDGGLYKCVATNALGTAETSAYITVEGLSYHKDAEEASQSAATESLSQIGEDKSNSIIHPPKFIDQIAVDTEELQSFQLVRLLCRVQSTEPLAMQWSKDGAVIVGDLEKHEIHQFSDGVQILVIHDANETDNGVYTCKAETEHGLTSTSAQLKIPIEESISEQLQVQQEVITQEQQPPTQVVEHSVAPPPTDVNLEFQSKDYVDSAVFEKKRKSPIVEEQGEKADVTELKKKEEEYKLLVKVADSVAHSLVANIFVDALNEAVRIIVRESEQQSETLVGPPRFDSLTDEFMVREGDELKIETKVYGVPTPFVAWYHGEEKLNVNKNTTMSYEKGVVSITLKNIDATQTGNYYCHATNVHGTAVLSLRVIVENIPDTEDENSLLQMTVSKFVRTEDGSTVNTNVNIVHRDEEFEHKITVVESDKEIVESSAEAIETSLSVDIPIKFEAIAGEKPEQAKEQPIEEQVTTVVTVSRPGSAVDHNLVIREPEDGVQAVVLEKETVLHTEEVMQTKDILLTTGQPEKTTTESMHTKSKVLLDKPTEKAAGQTVIPYEEKARVLSERFLAAQNVNLPVLEGVNDMLSTVIALKDQHKAHEEANVEVRRAPITSEHVVTVLEGDFENIELHIKAPTSSAYTFIDLETILQKPSTSNQADLKLEKKSRKSAKAEHRIVILEGVSKTFKEAITWSIKKVQKALGIQSSKTASTVVEISGPGDEDERVSAVMEMEECIPELMNIAATAGKVKIQNVVVSLVKQGDSAHQELVIEYEGQEETDARQGIADLVFGGLHSRQEDIFRRRPRGPHGSADEEEEADVVAVFVEVDANCPDQSVEIVATVSSPEEELPPSESEPIIQPKLKAERSFSISESVSTAALQIPKFFRKLTDKQANPGEPTTFKCIVSGTPMPEVRWTVDGDVILDNEDYSTVYEDGVCLLKINETLPEDEGEYQCEARNPAGLATTKCFLKVLGGYPSEHAAAGIRENQDSSLQRYIQHIPSKSSVIDEEEDEEEYNRRLSQISADYVRQWDDSPGAIARGRLVTAISDFELFRIVNYNEDLKETSAFYKYFETGQARVKITELVQEEYLFGAFKACDLAANIPSPIKKVPPPIPPRPKELVNFVRKTRSQTEVLIQNMAHCYVEIDLAKRAEYEEEEFVFEDYGYMTTSIYRSLYTPFTGLWDYALFNPFEHAAKELQEEQKNTDFQEKLLLEELGKPRPPSESLDKEPRSADLPNRVLYKGQEIEVTTKTKVLDKDPLSKNPEYVKAVQKYVEAMFDFEVPIFAEKGEKKQEKRSIFSEKQQERPENEPNFSQNQGKLPEKTSIFGQNEENRAGNQNFGQIHAHRPEETQYFDQNQGNLPEKTSIFKENQENPLENPRILDQNQENRPSIHTEYQETKTEKVLPRKPQISTSDCEESGASSVYPPSSADLRKDRKSSHEENTDHPWSQSSSLPNSPVKEQKSSSSPEKSSPKRDLISTQEVRVAPEKPMIRVTNLIVDKAEVQEPITAENPVSTGDNQLENPFLTGETVKTEAKGLQNPVLTSKTEPTKPQNPVLASTTEDTKPKNPTSTHKTDPVPNILIKEEPIRSESRLRREEGIKKIAHIAQQVEEELSILAEGGVKRQKEEDDLKEIERTILSVAEKLMIEKPVSKAQAEAKKELLRATLADMILNPPKSHLEPGQVRPEVRSPLQILRDNLDIIEESQMEEIEVDEVDEPSEVAEDSEVRNIIASPQRPPKEKPPTLIGARSPKIKKVPSQELLRMTPLTSNIREQLDVLENLLEEASREEQMRSGLDPGKAHGTIHDLFVQINAEIITIKKFCGKKLSRRGADAVVAVLHKVKAHIASIVNIMHLTKQQAMEKLRDGSPEKLVPETSGKEKVVQETSSSKKPVKEAAFTKKPAKETAIDDDERPPVPKHESTPIQINVSYQLRRREQSESAFATVIFRSFSRSHSEGMATSSMRYSYDYRTDKSTESMKTLTLTEIEEEAEGSLTPKFDSRSRLDSTPIPPPRPRRAQSRESAKRSRPESAPEIKISEADPVPPPRKKRSASTTSRDDQSTSSRTSKGSIEYVEFVPKMTVEAEKAVVELRDKISLLTDEIQDLDLKPVEEKVEKKTKTSPAKIAAIQEPVDQKDAKTTAKKSQSPAKIADIQAAGQKPVEKNTEKMTKTSPATVAAIQEPVQQKDIKTTTQSQCPAKAADIQRPAEKTTKTTMQKSQSPANVADIHEPVEKTTRSTTQETSLLSSQSPAKANIQVVTSQSPEAADLQETVDISFKRKPQVDHLNAIIITKDHLSDAGSTPFLFDSAELLCSQSGDTPKRLSRASANFEALKNSIHLQNQFETPNNLEVNENMKEMIADAMRDDIEKEEKRLIELLKEEQEIEKEMEQIGSRKSSNSSYVIVPRPESPSPDRQPSLFVENSEEVFFEQSFVARRPAEEAALREIPAYIIDARKHEPQNDQGLAYEEGMDSNEMLFVMEARESSAEVQGLRYAPPVADETNSIQLVCEESDNGTDTENSGMMRGQATGIHLIRSPEYEDIHEELLEELRQSHQDMPDIRRSPPRKRSIDEKNTQLKPPFLLFKDENYVVDESDLNSASENLSVSQTAPVALSTITERTEMTNSADAGTLKRHRSDDTMNVVVDENVLSQMDSTMSPDLLSPRLYKETDIISDDEEVQDSLGPMTIETTTKEFMFKKKHQRCRLQAVIHPDVRIRGKARIATDNSFDVLVEHINQEFEFKVHVYKDTDVVDGTALTILVDDLSESQPSLKHNLDDFTETSSFDDFEEIRDLSDDESRSRDDIPEMTGVTVSIIARSMYDIVDASLEEIPWGEVEMTVPYLENSNVMVRSMDSDSKMSSVQFNVTVSESNEMEKKKLKSQDSVRSSKCSIDEDKTESAMSLNIPSYVIRLGSTATITCELNNYLPSNSRIQWMKGKTTVEKVPGKVDRISHDLLEVLVISQVTMDDTDMYSLIVNDEAFPVAYLIVEEQQEDDHDQEVYGTFVSPAQTLFVMDGQPAVLSVQISDPSQRVIWFKERRPMHETSRVHFETNDEGFQKVIFSKTSTADQGTYYAYLGENFTAITLVVEERIDEREVLVVASGTESEQEEEMREYLVPPGSTATIACELEDSDKERDLLWIKDGHRILFSNETKVEHVVNGLKHYLVIHDTEPIDSGLYSVAIQGIEFKVAHLAVSDMATSQTNLRRKRISNTSIGLVDQ